MSVTAQQVLTAFESLPLADREAVVAELLTRHPLGASEMPDDVLIEMADDLFVRYDAEEEANAAAPD